MPTSEPTLDLGESDMAVRPVRIEKAKSPKTEVAVASVASSTPTPASDSATSALAVIERVLLNPDLPVERIEQAFAIYERMDKMRARRAFDAALAGAKAKIPVIAKNRTVQFDTKGGDRTEYRHEDLAEIARTVDPILAEFGLSYRFRTTSHIGEPVVVTCILSHADGHFEENTLSAGRDESGKKNAIQSIGSTITYLQRYSLKAALGLAAAADDDGTKAEQTAAEIDANAPISDDEEQKLRDAMDKAGVDIQKFCAYFKLEKIGDITKAQIGRAYDAINKKAKGA